MKKSYILATVTVAASSVILLGCSKSKKEGVVPSNNSSATANANGGSAPSGPVDLKIKWQTGKEYDMEMTLSQSTDVTVANRPYQQVLNLTQDLQYSPVKDLGKDGCQLKLEFQSQKLDFVQNGKEIVNYDSNQKTAPQPNTPAASVTAVMRAMLNVPLIYTISADGKVEKIDGIDTLTNNIAAAEPNQRQRAALQQLFEEQTLKQYGGFSEALPGHPVSIGDTWTSHLDRATPAGTVTVDANYTFKNWEQHDGHNCAHILIDGNLKTKSTSASTVGAVVNIKNGVIKGDAWFDPDLGMFVDNNSDQDMTLDITTRSGHLTEQMKQNVRMSLLGVNP